MSRTCQHEHWGCGDSEVVVETQSWDLRTPGVQETQHPQWDGRAQSVKIQENHLRHQGDHRDLLPDELQRLPLRRSHMLLPSWQLLLRQELHDMFLRFSWSKVLQHPGEESPVQCLLQEAEEISRSGETSLWRVRCLRFWGSSEKKTWTSHLSSNKYEFPIKNLDFYFYRSIHLAVSLYLFPG